MAQVETEKQVVTGVEVMCSKFGDIGPVVEADSVLVVVGPVENVGVSVVAVNVSAYELADPLVHLGPPLKTGSEDEVSCSVVEFVLFAILSVASMIHIGPAGLVGRVPEVKVCEVESIGPVVKEGSCVQVTDPVVEAPDPVL